MSTLSACLIVRDEEQNLPLCLAALAPFVDEICVLDTGSRDATVSIAREHGAIVGEFTWCNDFAAARNASLKLASSDWILTVDADELLVAESAACLPELLANKEAQAWLVGINNLKDPANVAISGEVHSFASPRLFRRRNEIFYNRPVHESIMNSLLELDAPTPQPSDLLLIHSGYLPEVVRARNKRERNLTILEIEFNRDPEEAFNAYKLCTTYITLGRDADALQVLQKSWPAAHSLPASQKAQLPFLPEMCAQLVQLELKTGEMGRAKEAADQGLINNPHASELLFQRAEVDRCCGYYEQALQRYTLAHDQLNWDDLSMGDLKTHGVQILMEMAKSAALCGDLEKANHALGNALAISPQNMDAKTLEARLLAVAGDETGSWAALGKLLDENPSHGQVALLAAEMAWAKGESTAAHSFWQVAARTPNTHSSAEAWMAMAKLAGGDLTPPVTELIATDLQEAAARLVLAVIFDGEYMPESEFDRSRLLEEIHAWLAELARDPDHAALLLFHEKAAGHEQACPGLQQYNT